MNKHLFLIVAALVLGCGCMQAQVRVQINGSQSFDLTEAGGLYFANDSMTVVSTAGVAEYALGDVYVVTFVTQLGINQITDASVTIAPNPAMDYVMVQGIGQQPQMVTIYSVAGVKLHEQMAADGSRINISHLPEGTYVLRCGDKVAKIIKQQ